MGIGANTQNIEPSIHDENVWSCKKDRSVYFEVRSLVCSFPSPAPALSLSWSSCSAPASTWRSWWSGWHLTLQTPPSRRSSPPTGSRWQRRVKCYAPTHSPSTWRPWRSGRTRGWRCSPSAACSSSATTSTLFSTLPAGRELPGDSTFTLFP